jgi:hypothetical protein
VICGLFTIGPNKTEVLNEAVVDEVIGCAVLGGSGALGGGHGKVLKGWVRWIVKFDNTKLTCLSYS